MVLQAVHEAAFDVTFPPGYAHVVRQNSNCSEMCFPSYSQ